MHHVFVLSVHHDMSETQINEGKRGFKEMVFLNFLRCCTDCCGVIGDSIMESEVMLGYRMEHQN